MGIFFNLILLISFHYPNRNSYCATIANFAVILKNSGAPDGQEKQYPRFHFGLRWNRKIAKIDIPTMRNKFWYFGLE